MNKEYEVTIKFKDERKDLVIDCHNKPMEENGKLSIDSYYPESWSFNLAEICRFDVKKETEEEENLRLKKEKLKSRILMSDIGSVFIKGRDVFDNMRSAFWSGKPYLVIETYPGASIESIKKVIDEEGFEDLYTIKIDPCLPKQPTYRITFLTKEESEKLLETL